MDVEECPRGAEELEDILSLAEAAALCGLSAHTLAQQAERGRLRARKVGGVWVTTRECLGAYLAEHSRHGQACLGADNS